MFGISLATFSRFSFLKVLKTAKIPNCLPINKPNIIPSVIVSKSTEKLIPEKLIPLFAKAKIGMIKNITHDFNESAINLAGDSCLFSVSKWMHKAVIKPYNIA